MMVQYHASIPRFSCCQSLRSVLFIVMFIFTLITHECWLVGSLAAIREKNETCWAAVHQDQGWEALLSTNSVISEYHQKLCMRRMHFQSLEKQTGIKLMCDYFKMVLLWTASSEPFPELPFMVSIKWTVPFYDLVISYVSWNADIRSILWQICN